MASPTGSAGPSQSSPKPANEPAGNAELALKKIGKYEIQKKIGAGGMGAVYLASDTTLRRVCALKVLPQDKASNPTLVKRFKAEARSAANLRHDNIVAVYETGEADGYLYIALEYVDGTDVANLVHKRGMIPLKRSVEMVRQVTTALDHALQQGIVHRDIKPGNLLVRRDGIVKLADLGLARSLDDNIDTSITRAGTTVGTVDYMSPEQARDSKAADVRSDIYSLGCTWYFMLTGEPPFNEGSLTNKLRAHAETPIPDPRSLNPAVSEAVFGVLRRMTEKKPARRYQTPKELLDDLDAASLNGDVVSDAILGDMSEDDAVDDDGDFSDGDENDTAVARRTRTRSHDETDEEDQSAFEETERPSKARKKSKASKRDADDGPAFMPPPMKKRDKDKLPEKERPKRTNAPLFYALVGLVAIGIAMGIVSLVMQFGMSSDTAQNDRMGNPFARRDEVAQQGGPGKGTSNVGGNAASGATQGAGANAADGQPGGTTIGAGQPVDSAGNVIGGQSGSAVEPGSVASRVGGDSTIGGSDSGNPGDASNTGSTVGGPASPGGPLGAPGNTTIGGGSSGSGNVTIGGSSGTASSGGAGKTGTGGSGARPSSPHIEARTKQEAAFLPGWASQPRPAGNLATLVVGADAAGDGKFATLNEALEHVSAAGAIIKLAGNGPFALYPVKIVDKTRIIIEPLNGSDPGAAPVIVLQPPKEGSVSNFVELSNTTFDLRRIHLAIDADGFETDPDDALLSAVASDLYLQNCSLSVKGLPESPMTAVKITGKVSRSDAKASPQPRVLIDNTLVLGNKLTALTVNSEHLDLVVRNTMIWSGAATSMRFGPIARSDADSARNVRLASTTICSLQGAVQIAGDASQPAPTSMELLNSLIAVPAGGKSAVLLNMEGWNQNQQKTAFGKFINWKSTASLYTGWTTLIRLNPGEVASATSPAQWQSAWKDKDKGQADKDQFQSAHWPGQPIADISAAASLDPLAPQTVGKQFVKTGEGGWPGCQTERLTPVKVVSLVPARVAATRPALPRGLFDSPASNVIRVDVTKEDLGKFLERQKLQNGTHIIASGSGQRSSSPIVIENSWVRLQFEQTEGAPLVLVPKSAESKYDGFITVVNGGIEIVGAAFTMPASERQAMPKWFIQIIDGDLAMWHCRVQGALNGAARNKGLIQVLSRSGRPPARLFEGRYDGYTWFDSCYLAGSGTMIEADTRRRTLVVKNCVVASRDDLFSLNVGQPDSDVGSTVDVSYSTLSAANRFFQVHGSDLGAPSESPVVLYADRCVFAPPLRAGQQKVTPTLLSYAGPVLDQKQIVWWEKRCGYAPEITRFLRSEADSAATPAQDFEKIWVSQWGTGQISEPLLGVKGVVLQKELPTKAEDRAKLEPTDFQLHAACRAATWDDKRTIGAYIGVMNVPALRPSAVAAEKKKPAKTAPPTSGSSQPGF